MQQLKDLMRRIYKKGVAKPDRTGVGTLSGYAPSGKIAAPVAV